MERRKITPSRVRSIGAARKKKTWILLLNRTRAKLIEHPGIGKQLKSIGGYVNPEGKLTTKELVTDRPGRVYGTAARRHAVPASEQAHEHSLTVFSRELASILEKGLASGKCDRIIVAAEPHCLGKIKTSLSKQARKKLQGAIGKDLFHLNNRDLFTTLGVNLS